MLKLEDIHRHWHTGCTQSRLGRRQRERRSKRIIQRAAINAAVRATVTISRCKARLLYRGKFYRSRSLPSTRLRVVRQDHRIGCGQERHRHDRQPHSDDVNRRLKTSPNASPSALSRPRSSPLARCLTVSRRVSEEVDNEAGEGVGSEVDEEMLEGALQRVKLTMFRPST